MAQPPVAKAVLRAILPLLAILIFSVAQAGATGTVRVQQSDGSVRTYDDVSIRVKHNTLRIGSKDKKGVLVIDRAACSYVGELLRCLPTSFQLVQTGQTKTIQLTNGLVYLNLTDSPQQMTFSSKHMQPHALMLTLHTLRGTYITIRGQIDELQP
ncbi:MAG TPA: hypothetical protein VMB20_02715 [Candidatus Acidoferrum sp.]|nr:hypothetical protein [Candidatus Acidoferrum sp.]